jgi:hypothetical protein
LHRDGSIATLARGAAPRCSNRAPQAASVVRSEIDKVLFDTATLDSGDLFALLLLAPATFSMVNKLGSAQE